jgi:molybdopterin/thiamine biosynthesis adenylyltransferase
MSDLGLGQDDKTIVILKGNEVHGFIVLDTQVAVLTTIAAQKYSKRLDESHEMLGSKSVAVVGCGSMGSKIATMLARSGVESFFLVDDDILFPDNLVRHDLDWRDVGSHKAEALADRLRRVNPAAKVTVRNIRMAGHESSGSAETAVASLAACDLIVDATANPDVFNLLANLVDNIHKPVVWAEVFGGGFGGLIARCRPDVEPPLQLMRRSIENWFQDRDYDPQRVARRYETDRDGVPMIADDADVTSIAAPAARLAIDTLLSREPSYFSRSAYVIGLGPEDKLFSQAFETYPIDLGEMPALAEKPKLSQEEAAAELGALAKMFEIKCD